MDLRPWLLFIHIAAAMTWVGGGAVLALTGLRARGSGDSVLLLAFGRSVQYVGIRVFGPSMVLVLLAGIGLVLVEARSFTEPWILLALGGFALAFVLGAVFVARTAIAITRVVAQDRPDATALDPLIGRWLTGYGLILAVLAVVLWDMIFKPGV